MIIPLTFRFNTQRNRTRKLQWNNTTARWSEVQINLVRKGGQGGTGVPRRSSTQWNACMFFDNWIHRNKTGRLIAGNRGGIPILTRIFIRIRIDPCPRKGRNGPVVSPICCTRNAMETPTLIYAVEDRKTICRRPGNISGGEGKKGVRVSWHSTR